MAAYHPPPASAEAAKARLAVLLGDAAALVPSLSTTDRGPAEWNRRLKLAELMLNLADAAQWLEKLAPVPSPPDEPLAAEDGCEPAAAGRTGAGNPEPPSPEPVGFEELKRSVRATMGHLAALVETSHDKLADPGGDGPEQRAARVLETAASHPLGPLPDLLVLAREQLRRSRRNVAASRALIASSRARRGT